MTITVNGNDITLSDIRPVYSQMHKDGQYTVEIAYQADKELTEVMLGGISWKSQCLAITALRKMKGE